MTNKQNRDILVKSLLNITLPDVITTIISGYDHVYEGIKNVHLVNNNSLKHITPLNNGNMVTISDNNEVIIWKDRIAVGSYLKDKPNNISRIIALKEDLYVIGVYNYREYISSIEIYYNDELRYITKYYGNVIKLMELPNNKLLIGHSLGVNGIENILRVWDYTSGEEKNCKRIGDDDMKISLRRNNTVCLKDNNLIIATSDANLLIFNLDGDLETPIKTISSNFSAICLTVVDNLLIYSHMDKSHFCCYDGNIIDKKIINNKVKIIKLLNKNRCAVVVTDCYGKDIIQIWNYIKKYMLFAFPEINKDIGESISLGGLTVDEKLFYITSKENLVMFLLYWIFLVKL